MNYHANFSTSPIARDPYPSRCEPLPSATSRKDPVAYQSWYPEAPLTPEQVQQYEHNGFLHLTGLFSADEIAVWQEALERVRRDPRNSNPEEIVTEPDNDAVRSVFRVHETQPAFAHLASDERLVRIAEFLLDDQVYIYQSRINFKPGFSGRDFMWHSDFETWHIEDGLPRMRTLSMSISLAKNTEFNGPLMLIPKSHKTYVPCPGETPLEHYKWSLKQQQIGVPDPASITDLYEDAGIVVPKGPAGSITIFDCNLLHGSNSNISPLPRSNVFLVYNSISNQAQEPFSGGAPRPEFLATRQNVRPLTPTRRH